MPRSGPGRERGKPGNQEGKRGWEKRSDRVALSVQAVFTPCLRHAFPKVWGVPPSWLPGFPRSIPAEQVTGWGTREARKPGTTEGVGNAWQRRFRPGSRGSYARVFHGGTPLLASWFPAFKKPLRRGAFVCRAAGRVGNAGSQETRKERGAGKRDRIALRCRSRLSSRPVYDTRFRRCGVFPPPGFLVSRVQSLRNR
jgi:hypothetical protein